MMSRNELLLVLDAFGGNVQGKTLLQKRIYFLRLLLGENPEEEFRAYYYGPYSDTVSDDLGLLRSSGLVDERVRSFGGSDPNGFERARYDYRLTDHGRTASEFLKSRYPEESARIGEAVARLRAAGELDYVALSIAAKTHYILSRSSRPLVRDEIRKEARKLGWEIADDKRIDDAVSFLQKLELANAPV